MGSKITPLFCWNFGDFVVFHGGVAGPKVYCAFGKLFDSGAAAY